MFTKNIESSEQNITQDTENVVQTKELLFSIETHQMWYSINFKQDRKYGHEGSQVKIRNFTLSFFLFLVIFGWEDLKRAKNRVFGLDFACQLAFL